MPCFIEYSSKTEDHSNQQIDSNILIGRTLEKPHRGQTEKGLPSHIRSFKVWTLVLAEARLEQWATMEPA